MMQFKKIFFSMFCIVCLSCSSQKDVIPYYSEVLSKNVKIIGIDKKRKYYNVKGVDELGDTLVLITKNDKVYSRTNTNERSLYKLEIDRFYELDMIELNPIGRVGEFGKVSIIVHNDTLWKGVIRDSKDYSNKYYRVLDVYYKSTNNE
ncbi:hypothetical protein ACKUSY_06185 [Myroides odoratus]